MTAVSTRITATIVFDGDVPTPTRGVVHVAVLDVSRADAAAISVISADLALGPEASSGSGQPTEVSFDDVPLEPGRDYIVRAHWERHGGDEVRPGDQLTTSSVPVIAGARSVSVTVPLTQIA